MTLYLEAQANIQVTEIEKFRKQLMVSSSDCKTIIKMLHYNIKIQKGIINYMCHYTQLHENKEI
jgi:DUF438 domain-containing protein